MWLRNNTEEISVDEIAQIVGGELIGNGSEKIVGVCSFTAPIANCITYVKDTNLLFKNELSELSAIS
ncbi:MAG: hypothetical protein R3A13_03215 [Bdellovibrionota bacterium]